MRLSIILTVFNKEPFLHRAFDNLVNQEDIQDGDYEVLVVNDGSTDGSAAIIEHYVRRNKCVRVLTQTNQGLSMARNNGTLAAKGDYIWYVDADDVVSKQSVRLICEAMTMLPDVIPIYAQDDGRFVLRNQVPLSVRTGSDVLLSKSWEQCAVFWVIRREFLQTNSLHFYPGIYHEDAEFTPRMLYSASSISVVPEVLYTVIHEPNSITGTPRAKRAFDCLIAAESLCSFVENNRLSNTAIGDVFDYQISLLINTGFFVIAHNSSNEQKRFEKSLQEKPNLLRPLERSHTIKYRIEAFLLKVFPKRAVRIYNLIK